MKKAAILCFAAVLGCAAIAPARAQMVGPLAGILVNFPAGGDAMTANIEAALQDPALTPSQFAALSQETVALARNANPDQKASIARAMFDVLRYFEASGCGASGNGLRGIGAADCAKAGLFRDALRNLDPTTRAIFAALQAAQYAQNGHGERSHSRNETVFYPGGLGGFAGGGANAALNLVSPH